MVGLDGPRGWSARDLSRSARRLGRRLRRALKLRSIVAVSLIAISLAVVLSALSGPPSRATVFRTDPVLRAMGVPEDEPEGEFAALAAVPSLSVSPRFVLPVQRDESKRLLAALPPPSARFPRSRSQHFRPRPRPNQRCRLPWLWPQRPPLRSPPCHRASRLASRSSLAWRRSR